MKYNCVNYPDLKIKTVKNINDGLYRSLTSKYIPWLVLDNHNDYEDCLYFTGSKNKKGYGQINCGKTNRWLAHRASYYLFVDDLPHNKLVLHKCDRPSCINPDHLFLGTASDNTKDMLIKGRAGSGNGFIGSDHYSSKINEEDAVNIKKLLLNNLTAAQIVVKLNNKNITKHIVYDIKRKRTWKHVEIIEQLNLRMPKELINKFKILAIKNSTQLRLYVHEILVSHLKEVDRFNT
ncbi:MAG TPA: HNH endonuclease [Methanosarcinales archaeon]|nr:HNH endonuclease [Methanosarcinales archaeon]